MSGNKNYSTIFKTTFLFGFVQIINIVVKVVLNKIVAVSLGTQGIGLIGLYTSAIGMLKTGASLGVSQSAIRDISESKEENDSIRFSKTIVTTNRVIIATASLGGIITIILSPLLSEWTFGNNLYVSSFVIVSLAVMLTILFEGQLAILKGLRQLKLLAKANIIGSLAGLILAIPIYMIYKEQGIIPVLIILPFCAFLWSSYYVRKVKRKRLKLSLKETYMRASSMIKMGIALSFATLLSQVSIFGVSAFISNESGLKSLGFYNAGIMIMVGYFSVIINALTTDYYPRIAAINSDNDKVQDELNQQSIVSLLMLFPLMVLFLFLLPLLITFLYSEEFSPIIDFVRIGIYGTLITICSNQVDLILIAKNETKVYIFLSIIYRILDVLIKIYLFKVYGLEGLGVAMVLTGIIHIVMMIYTVKKLYDIRFEKLFVKTALVVLFFIFIASYISTIDNFYIRFPIGFVIFVLSCLFSVFFSKKYLGFNFFKMLSK